MSLSTTCRPISSIQGFSLTAGQQSIPMKIPAGCELSVVIPTIGGGVVSGGTITVDFTQSLDSTVISSPPTAVWTTAARTYTASTAAGSPVKIGQECWLRFNCVSGSGQVSLDPSGTLSNYTKAPFGGVVQVDPVSGLAYANSALLNYPASPQVVGGSVAAAAANVMSIQGALSGGGSVTTAGGLGDVYINQTLVIPANTSFVVGKGSRLKLAPGSNCNMLRNTNWASAANAVTQVSTPDAGITMVVQSSVLPALGSYAMVLGAVPRVYNLCGRVIASGGGVFTIAMSTHLAPAETPTTPATGTITWLQVDENIYVEGEFDYDGANQTTPDTWQKHALYLRRLYNFGCSVTVRNATKYALALGNIYHSRNLSANFDTFSDGMHLAASGADVAILAVTGKTGDDMVAAGNSDYPQYIDSAYVVGDFGSISVGDILPDGSLSAFKYFGCSTNTAESIRVGNVSGRISGGAGYVNLICDPGVTNGTSATLEKFEIGSITPVDPVSSAVVQTSGNITSTSVKIGRLDTAVNNSANARPILIGAGATITSLEVGDLVLQAPSYFANSIGIYVIGTVVDAHINNYYAKNIGLCAFMSGSAGASKFRIDNWNTINCGQAYRTVSGSSQELVIGWIGRNGYQGSPHIDFSNSGGGQSLWCGSATGMSGTDAFGGSTGFSKDVFWAPGIGIDVGLTGVVRQNGAMVLFNSGSARGTLVVGNLVVCDATGAAGSWKQLSNSALNF